MCIITISRGSYSHGREVAEKVAKELDYQCVSREILLEASEQFHIPEIKLLRAIHDPFSVFNRFTYGKEKYIAYLHAALLKCVQKDNVVYHGLAGHFFLQEIPHVLKVRVIANLEDRVKEEMKREGISAEEARYILKKDDDERRKWGLQLYGYDTVDSSLYDLVVHIKRKKIDDVVGLILYAAKMPCFQTTPESQKIINDLTLAAEVKAALVNEFPTSALTAKDGAVYVKIEVRLSQQAKTTDEITRIAEAVNGVKKVEVYVSPLIGVD
jgi:cytidylate kinase